MQHRRVEEALKVKRQQSKSVREILVCLPSLAKGSLIDMTSQKRRSSLHECDLMQIKSEYNED